MITLLYVSLLSGSMPPTKVVLYTDYPVSSRLGRKSSSSYFIQNKKMTVGSKSSFTRAKGFYDYPFVDKAYYFVAGKLAEFFTEKTGNLKDFREAYAEQVIWYCDKCKRSVPGESDCITCNQGIHRREPIPSVVWEENLCVCCQHVEVKESWDTCQACVHTFEGGEIRKDIGVHPLDRRPKTKSKSYKEILKWDLQKVEELQKSEKEKAPQGTRKLYSYVCDTCGGHHEKMVDTCVVCGLVGSLKESHIGWEKIGNVKKEKEYVLPHISMKDFDTFFDHFLGETADAKKGDRTGLFDVSCPNCRQIHKNLDFNSIVKIPKCSCGHLLVVDVDKDIIKPQTQFNELQNKKKEEKDHQPTQ